MKKFLCFLLLLAGLAAAAVLISQRRERSAGPAAGLPGRPHGGPEGAPAEGPGEMAPADTPVGEDLSRVRGIGPVYRARLAEAGITTFAELAASDPAALAAAAGVPESRAAGWIDQASRLAAG